MLSGFRLMASDSSLRVAMMLLVSSVGFILFVFGFLEFGCGQSNAGNNPLPFFIRPSQHVQWYFQGGAYFFNGFKRRGRVARFDL